MIKDQNKLHFAALPRFLHFANENRRMKMKNENSKLWIKCVLTLLALGCCVALAFLCGGCRYFYENAGSHTRVGSLTAPVEVSEPSDSITVRALYSMDGADVYTAKDSLVKITYRNCYTNNYFALVKTQGEQDLQVEIEPLDCSGGCDTNGVVEASK